MKKLIYFVAFVMLCSACKEQGRDEAVPISKPESNLSSKDVQFQEGVLKFQSKEHLKNVAQELSASEKYSSFEGKSGFNSLLMRQNSLTDAEIDNIAMTKSTGKFSDIFVLEGSGDDISLEPIVSDKYFAALLNNGGFVIVGDSAYHIGYKLLHSIEIASQPSRLKRFVENPEMAGVTTAKIIRESIRNARESSIKGDAIVDYDYDGDKFRFFGQFDRNLAGIYTSLLVKVRHQRRRFFIWIQYDTQSIGFSGSGYFWQFQNIPVYTFPWSGSSYGSNTSEQSVFVTESFNGVGSGWVSGSASASCVGRNGSYYPFTFSP